jgi:quercetin dioxygenase-like cupin family protein
MKKLGVFAVALALLATVGGTHAFAQKKMKKEAVLWAADDVKWETMKNAPPGAMVANLWGDISKGAYGALVKLPAGLETPLHTHSHDVKLVIISGTMLHTPEGGKEMRYGPGSYLFIPNTDRHITKISSDGPCLLFQESDGAFDLKPVEKK